MTPYNLSSMAEADEYKIDRDLSTFSKNAAENGHLPPAPLPILGPMSHVQNRDNEFSARGNVQRVDVNVGGDAEVVGPSSTMTDDEGNSDLGISNPTYVVADDLRKGESAL